MNKIFVTVLASASLLACGGKKESTTPVNKDNAPVEHKADATGGAAYGGKSADAPAKDAANPCAPNPK